MIQQAAGMIQEATGITEEAGGHMIYGLILMLGLIWIMTGI